MGRSLGGAMLQPIEKPVIRDRSRRLLPVTLLALGLFGAAPLRAADETGITLEHGDRGNRVTVSHARIRQHLERGDRVRVFEHSGGEYELVIVAIGAGRAPDLSGEYIATITGNRRVLRLRDSQARVSLSQTGTSLSGNFDRGRGRIWGVIDGDRIRFEWFAVGGNSGKGEWRIAPDGPGLRGSWYSHWQGDGDWDMRRIDDPEGARSPGAATLVGERPADGFRIEVALARIERIRIIPRAEVSNELEPAAQNAAGFDWPEPSQSPGGDTGDPSPGVIDAPVPDLWEGLGPGETGFEIGALALLGADFSVYHRPAGSPWLFGYRYLRTRDDFVAIDFDDSDKEEISIAGPFARYLFSPGKDTYYLSGGFFKMTQRVECRLGSDEDSATSLFVGGGFMGWRHQAISYNIGFLFAPGVSLEVDTGDCSSKGSGFDINASFTISVR